jgi:hypothetical protein
MPDVETWMTPFVPADPINISSDSGNIGRFYWQNKATLNIEQWGDNNFYEVVVSEFNGEFAFLWTEFDWIAWVIPFELVENWIRRSKGKFNFITVKATH